MKIGDRVYHRGIQANGHIIDIDDTKQRDKYKVEFYWAHYCDVRHGNFRGYKYPDRKWTWASDEYLVLNNCVPTNPKNSIALNTSRITDKRLHLVGEIPYQAEIGRPDIIIRYGGQACYTPCHMVINEHPVFDKRVQMSMLGEDLVSPTYDRLPDGADPKDWIIKPRRSCGGKNIRTASGNWPRPGDYYQKRFFKTREFRAHCFLWNDNPVPFIQEKVIGDPNQLCWNKKQGGGFRYIYQDGLDYGPFMGRLDTADVKRMTAMSVDALKRLKYDSGGIDFGMDDAGNMKIFEVNSAMGLRERSLFTYKKVYWKLSMLNINDYRNTRWA